MPKEKMNRVVLQCDVGHATGAKRLQVADQRVTVVEHDRVNAQFLHTRHTGLHENLL